MPANTAARTKLEGGELVWPDQMREMITKAAFRTPFVVHSEHARLFLSPHSRLVSQHRTGLPTSLDGVRPEQDAGTEP